MVFFAIEIRRSALRCFRRLVLLGVAVEDSLRSDGSC